MLVYSTISDTKLYLELQRKKGYKIGFVPTMGALHKGHLSLIEKSVKENDITIASVFVNPLQFNDKNDLVNYPRTLEKDCELLASFGCNAVFAPSEQEMYAQEVKESYNFGSLEQVMEGHFRPGHFNGVAIVVKRLFDIVNPTNAYFGLKDFQQYTIIRALANQLNLPINIIGCETVREDDGLAMSSRNVLLTPEFRIKALIISQSLNEAQKLLPTKSINEILTICDTNIKNAGLITEYVSIVDYNTLMPIDKFHQNRKAIICIAAYAGNVRLIDNKILTL